MSTNRHSTKKYGSHQVGHRFVTCIKYKITKYIEIFPYLFSIYCQISFFLIAKFLILPIPTIGMASCKIKSELK